MDLIRGGFVEVVYQAHDLTVELGLKDGRSLNTAEPSIDAVLLSLMNVVNHAVILC